MVQWRERHVGYKLGFCGLVVSIVGYAAGFGLPYWSLLRLHDYGYVDQTIGLWQACIHQSLTCISNVHGDNPPWINAARALSCFALFFFMFVLVSGYYRNVSRAGQLCARGRGRHIESVAIVGSVIGFTACIIYAAEFHRIYISRYDVGHLYWGFGLVCGALGAVAISAVAMFIFNRPVRRGGASTLRLRGPNGLPVNVHFPAELGEDRLHIPYFGDIAPDQLAMGAGPTLPPSYETATGGVAYAVPPSDVSDAPPLYEDVTKDSLPPPVVAGLGTGVKDESPPDPSP